MSLFDKLSGAGASGNVIGSADGAIRSGASQIGSRVGNLAGGGRLAGAVSQAGASIGAQAASRAMHSHIPPGMRNTINAGAQAASQIAGGDIEGGILTALEAGLAGDRLGNLLGGQASQGRYWSAANMLYGGITPSEAKRIYQEAVDAPRAKKNLYLLKVQSALAGDFSHEFNLFCTDIDRGPSEVSGGKARAGSAQLDTLTQAEPVVLRMTTMDDRSGTLKRWFEAHVEATAHADGSFGVPAEYAIVISIQHAFVGDIGAFTGRLLCRAMSYEVGLSRREDAMEELQMTFTQLDTFMSP
ncbi:hypothetical protein [Halomonas salipaludis]|uniref:Uncharacterized protein n=1 Tax=Halomonas salipaludis TaxID=2032625 RepID=A0A2A2F3R4_9GAMM|nr:hypothetical protein [Halomonas salipaludis]PAU79245.1 hypothetical protein CK498_02420 [Halomonas salipaludis]